MHYSENNPHWTRQVDQQKIWSFNVWCGILDNKIVKLYFFDGPLNAYSFEMNY